MPKARTSMRRIREVLRLQWLLGLSQRKIASATRLGVGTVFEYLRRAAAAELSWESVEGLSETELEQRLFPRRTEPVDGRSLPDFGEVRRELSRKGVTLSLLWQEYRERVGPEGYGYSRFCELYRLWEGQLELWMRQVHRAGEKLFVDYAGQTVEVVDRASGEVRSASIFVATLGASNFSYAEATWSQGLDDWIGSHVRAFAALGGVPEQVVPDNLKSGVKSPCWYDPETNRTYADLAEHYGVAVVPARVRRPKDKAKVENAVLQVSRWVLARLRNEQFGSLRELNDRIAVLMAELNDRPMRAMKASRRELFEQIDRPALRALPSTPYELSTWSKARVGPDYHVEVDGHYYSVPYRLVGKQLDVRATARMVEILDSGRRVAAHARSPRRGVHTTTTEHMPKAHQEHLAWTPPRLVAWAQKTGPSAAALVEQIMLARCHPQQGFRACLGIMRLAKTHGEDRLEAACARALAVGSLSYRGVKSILTVGLDRDPTPTPVATEPISHDNVRGADYYADSSPREVA